MAILIGGEKSGTGKSTAATNLTAIHSLMGADKRLGGVPQLRYMEAYF